MAFRPGRLSLARRRRGLTRRVLADAVQLAESTVTAYERGDRSPPPETAEQLARLLRFPAAFFYRDEVEPIAEEATSFRSMSRLTAAQRDRALAGGQLALELTSWIDERFDLPAADLPDLRPHRDPETAAMALRARWALGDSPVANMVWLLEAKGVRVFSLAEQAREVDAFSFWRGPRPFVFLNTMKSAERSRYDAAHELGHLVLHQHGQPNGREAEREADAFASALLMPRSSVLAFAPQFPTLERLIRAKRRWKVSVSALAHRMRDVGMLTDWQYRTLAIEIQTNGYRTKEPESIPREMSRVYEKVFRTLREEHIGRAELARMLGWPLAELDALVFQLVLAALPGGNGAAGSKAMGTKRDLKVL